MNTEILMIDGAYFYRGLKNSDKEIPYEAFIQVLAKELELTRFHKIYFYTGVFEGEEQRNQRKFLTWLGHNGFNVVEKTIVVDHDGKTKFTSLEVEMTVDAIRLAGCGCNFNFITGNANYRYLFDTLGRMGSRITLISFKKTPRELLGAVDRTVFVEEILKSVNERTEKSVGTVTTHWDDED